MSDEEITKQIYKCHKGNPIPGDLCILVKEDFENIGVYMTEEEITSSSTKDYKKYIKMKVRQAAFKEL